MVRFALQKPLQLGPELLSIWSRIQEAEPTLDSPYFRPEFVQDVARVRDDVEVAVFIEGGEPVGFFPFQRGTLNIGLPVGGLLSDFQGAVVIPTVRWSGEDLIRGCNLTMWRFDHLLGSQPALAAHRTGVAASPYMDLSGGFEAYRAARRQAGSQELMTVARKSRKAERELGPVRFEAHTADPEVLNKLVGWKVDQYARTGATNPFGQAWVLPLLKRILARHQEDFCGFLSTLTIGDRLAAAHLGMRSRKVLHSWFPGYDPAMSKYSPGSILLTKMAEASNDLGVTRIDLGKGNEPYKKSYMTGATEIGEGVVGRNWTVQAILRGWRVGSRRIRSSPLLYATARRTVRTLRLKRRD